MSDYPDEWGNTGTPGVNLYLDRRCADLEPPSILWGEISNRTGGDLRWTSRPLSIALALDGNRDVAQVSVVNFGLSASACTIVVGWLFGDDHWTPKSVAWGSSSVMVDPAMRSVETGEVVPGQISSSVWCSRERINGESPLRAFALVADPLFQPFTALQRSVVEALLAGDVSSIVGLEPLSTSDHRIAERIGAAQGLMVVTGSVPELWSPCALLVRGSRSPGTGSIGSLVLVLRKEDGSDLILHTWDPAPDIGGASWAATPGVSAGKLRCELRASFEGNSSIVTNYSNPDRVIVQPLPAAVASVLPGFDGLSLIIDDALGTDNDEDYRIDVLAG